ncbi:hypothetical protein AALP_AA6G240700 [Arabis alpina]|uniref:Uncharacterized protein n=1 Tax=Arabis alpina TaxID=50452 RepID=A0A087GRC7_ARAAL|nr:hypothetical protein AALP_AA6G240700 [Arabis alpina]
MADAVVWWRRSGGATAVKLEEDESSAISFKLNTWIHVFV